MRIEFAALTESCAALKTTDQHTSSLLNEMFLEVTLTPLLYIHVFIKVAQLCTRLLVYIYIYIYRERERVRGG